MLLIRSLNRGGAERQLASLAVGLNPSEFQIGVVTFYPGGAIWDELSSAQHIVLRSLDKKGRWDNLSTILHLKSLLQKWAPAILHCYMAEPSILGTIAGRLASVPAIVWGVRSSNMDYLKYGRFNWLTFQIAGAMSRLPDLIVANSEAGRIYHVARGYPASRVVTIANGIDAEQFRPSPEARWATRGEWRFAADDFIVGVVARLDPMKGHDTLLEAAVQVCRERNNVRIVCVGNGPSAYRDRLVSMTERLGLRDHVSWMGELENLPCVYPAFDLACSCSVFGEGFSNAVAEAMASGLPCVVTDVGDSRAIVADTGLVVACSDPGELARAILKMAAMDPAARSAIGERARCRIVSEFGVKAMIDRTAGRYRELVAGWSGPVKRDFVTPGSGVTRC
jgi:glycosyltransferase involved in cell wall biosynthesis